MYAPVGAIDLKVNRWTRLVACVESLRPSHLKRQFRARRFGGGLAGSRPARGSLAACLRRRLSIARQRHGRGKRRRYGQTDENPRSHHFVTSPIRRAKQRQVPICPTMDNPPFHKESIMADEQVETPAATNGNPQAPAKPLVGWRKLAVLLKSGLTPMEIIQTMNVKSSRMLKLLQSKRLMREGVVVWGVTKEKMQWMVVTAKTQAAAKLVDLTESDSAETSRKTCLEILDSWENKSLRPERKPNML
jgi:hypothetical protein